MIRKVLIIDDEKPTRDFIRKMLESFDLNLDHMFPINKPEFAIDNLRKALSRAALNF